MLPLSDSDPDEPSAAVLECLNMVMAEHGQPSLNLLSMDAAWQSCPPGGAVTAGHIQRDHPFLSHGAWAHCTRTFTVPGSVLKDRRGAMTPEAARAVPGALEACPRFK